MAQKLWVKSCGLFPNGLKSDFCGLLVKIVRYLQNGLNFMQPQRRHESETISHSPVFDDCV